MKIGQPIEIERLLAEFVIEQCMSNPPSKLARLVEYSYSVERDAIVVEALSAPRVLA